MNTDSRAAHVGERLSGYLDGELTQQDRQQVELHLANCTECRALYDELVELRTQLGQSVGQQFGNDPFREAFVSPTNRTLAWLGWGILIVAMLGLGIAILAGLIADDTVSTGMKLLFVLPYIGFALLFVAVLRRRLREARTDKYNDVEI